MTNSILKDPYEQYYLQFYSACYVYSYDLRYFEKNRSSFVVLLDSGRQIPI